MPELTPAAPPPRDELLRQLRGRLGELIPGLRLVADCLLGAESTIDFVGIEPSGRAVLVLVGGEDEDLELVGLSLAHLAWVKPRLRDWLQLAPDLGIRPEAGGTVWLLCPSFRPEAVAAARTLGADTLSLARYRYLRDAGKVEMLIETVFGDRESPPREPAPPPPAGPPAFRTGLSDADLGLSPEERSEFE
jgi:hypothetical protein